MKVYVAIGGYDYEGYCEPIGVFSTKELAERAIKEHRHKYDTEDVLEYEIDTPQDWLAKAANPQSP